MTVVFGNQATFAGPAGVRFGGRDRSPGQTPPVSNPAGTPTPPENSPSNLDKWFSGFSGFSTLDSFREWSTSLMSTGRSRFSMAHAADFLREIGTSLKKLPAAATLLLQAPPGDGHPVVLIPPFMANGPVMGVMAGYLELLGYNVVDLNLGFNTPRNANYQLESLTEKIRAVSEQTGQKVSLVGWSLGGVLSREVAKRIPDHVRSVTTMASPFAAFEQAEKGLENGGIAPWTLEKIRLMLPADETYFLTNPKIGKRLHQAPPVPTTAIYGRHDTVADPKACRQERSKKNRQVDNVVVDTGHYGIGLDPMTLYAVANRLAQPEGEWQPFRGDAISRNLRQIGKPADDTQLDVSA